MPAPVTPAATPFTGGANLQDFGDDDPTPRDQLIVAGSGADTAPPAAKAARPQQRRAAPVLPVNQPAQKPAAPQLQDFGDDEDEPVTTVVTPPAAPAGPTHHPDTVAWALSFGLTAEDMAEMTPDELGKEVKRMRRISQLRPAGPAAPAAPAAPPAAPEPEPEPVVDWGTAKNDDGTTVKFTDADIHPAVQAAVKGVLKRVAKLEKENESLRTQVQAAAGRPVLDRIQARVGSYGAFFGNGRPAPNSPEWERCAAVSAALERMGHERRLSGDPEADVDKVVATLFGLKPGAAPQTPPAAPAVPAAPASPATPAAGDPYSGTVARPTNRQAPAKKGPAAAVTVVADWMRKRGIVPEGMPAPGEEVDEFS